MRAALPVLLSVLLLASSARGADALEPTRARVKAEQQQILALRQEQLTLGRRIGALSQEIETLKGEGARKDAKRLDLALKESQALSGTLGDVTRALSTRERALEQTRTELLTGLGEALVQLRARYDRTRERHQRARLLDQMRGLRSESERLRAQLPPALMPTLPAEIVRSDDPEDLLAQADVLRDNEDRLKARLAELRTRLKQARAEADLSRRMDDFMDQASLFDEQDRRTPSRRPSTGFASSGDPAPEAPNPPTAPEGPTAGQDFELISRGGATPGSAFELSPLTGRNAPVTGTALDASASVAQLEVLERQLQARAREYAERAAALEKRARGR